MPFKEFLQVTQDNANEMSDLVKVLIGGGLVALANFIKSIIDSRNAKRLNDAQVTEIQDDLETKLWERVKAELSEQYITNARLREALNKRDERIFALESGLAERDKKISALQYELEEKTKRIVNLENIIGQLRKSETESERTIKNLQEQITVLQGKVKELESERNQLIAERNRLLDELKKQLNDSNSREEK